MVAANDADPLIARYVEDMHLSPSSPTFTMATRVLESGEPVLMPSVPYEQFLGMLRDDVREYLTKNQPPLNEPVRYLGVLVVPMRARGATVGTLGLYERRSSNPLTEHDVRWLQAIADRTGLAADNAQLYVDAISRLERLTALRNVGLAITGSPDLRLTLGVILDQVTAGLAIDAADVLLVDENDLRPVRDSSRRRSPTTACPSTRTCPGGPPSAGGSRPSPHLVRSASSGAAPCLRVKGSARTGQCL